MKCRVLFCLVVLTAGLIFAPRPAAQGPPPVLVVTDTVRQMEFHDQITLVGRTEARVTSRIVSEVSGRVQSVNAREGVWVASDSPLITIDAERLNYTLESKRAQASAAKEHARLAQTQRTRAEELFGQKLITNTGLDSAVAWASITQEQYNQLEAEKQLLEMDVRKSVISAPFSGYTVNRLVDVGEWVQPGMPVFEMVDISRARVRVDLPERYFGQVAAGSQVSVSLTAGDPDLFEGTVAGIAPNASEETHTFPVIIDVPNPEGRLGGGMLVRATLLLNNKFNSLAVSKDAIVRQGSQTLVYTVTEGKAAPVPVVTKSTDGKMVAVVSEQLSSGMPIVVRGNERIFPGSPVNVAGETPPVDSEKSDKQTQQAQADR